MYFSKYLKCQRSPICSDWARSIYEPMCSDDSKFNKIQTEFEIARGVISTMSCILIGLATDYSIKIWNKKSSSRNKDVQKTLLRIEFKWKIQWIELILLIHHQEKYISNFASFYGFQSLISIELTNLHWSVVVQPVIKQDQFVVRRRMEKWIFTSNKNFKFIFNQLGYFKGQPFGSLIMKYGFSRSMLSFIENDLTYQPRLSCIASHMLFFQYQNLIIRKMSTNRNLFCKIPIYFQVRIPPKASAPLSSCIWVLLDHYLETTFGLH